MSLDMVSEPVCYVHCNFCNTILASSRFQSPLPPPSLSITVLAIVLLLSSSFSVRAKVSVPSSSLFNIVTVRCGHCGNLLSVNMGASSQTLPLQDPQSQKLVLLNSEDLNKDFGSSSKCNKVNASESTEHHEPPRMPPIRPPEKRQRVPSAYNRFIKDEIQRIKAGNPDISHREAFSTAAKNWAHFPHIHFGLKLDSNKHAKLDHPSIAGDGAQKTSGLYEINGSL
ncbi:hypothetical protein DKX38_024482 [Salix brachista]|uniref:Uncharacterized protein n=1 Tax=Salix brachista TaxID=2182728 RepID=A0A5N5JS47_9ROSI|nr:hypothetical protein DKX38_024482 [Salix brachista]